MAEAPVRQRAQTVTNNVWRYAMSVLRNTTRILSIALLVFAAFGTQKVNSQILIGPTAGLSLGVFSVDNQAPDASNSYRVGLFLGGAVEARLSDIFSIEIEPAYIQKGDLISFNNGYKQVESKFRFGYVQIPLALKVRLVNHPITPYVTGGPNVGFLLSAKAVSDFNSPTLIEYDEMPKYKRTDVAIDFGAGCEYNMSSSLIFTVDARYSLGVYDIDKTLTGAVKTRGIQILIGALIPL